MKRPSFQFYADNWLGNKNLRRCTFAERGMWIDAMCLMHDSEEYGVLRWPLEELANALGCRVADLQTLRRKQVLKGADTGETFLGFQMRPRHAGREGPPIDLIQEQPGPLWFSSRMVWDEYKRQHSGGPTRFAPDDEPKGAPRAQPSQRHGDDQGIPHGHGASSSTPSTSPSLRSGEGRGTRLPADWELPMSLGQWALSEQSTWDADHVRFVAAQFKDHFISVSGAAGVKRDWEATWRKWVRKEGPKVAPRAANVTVLAARWKPGAEPNDVLIRVARQMQLPPWDTAGGETFGQFRQRIVDAGGEDELKPRRAS